MHVFNNSQVCEFNMTCFYIYFILKEKSYIIQFISKLNKFESLSISMVPQIENLTHKLDIGSSKKKINIQDIFSGNKIKWDLCEYTASKSSVLKSIVTIKHKKVCSLLKSLWNFMQTIWYNVHIPNSTKRTQ